MPNIPDTPTSIKRRINSYEKSLSEELDNHGFISDGAGKRFILAPMYLLIDDTAGALKAFCWYIKQFPDDTIYPTHSLSWALALYRGKQFEEAKKKLLKVHLSNPYTLKHLLNEPYQQLDPTQSHDQDFFDVAHGFEELFTMWNDQEKEWAKELRDSAEFTEAFSRMIETQKALLTEPVGPQRSSMVSELSAMLYGKED